MQARWRPPSAPPLPPRPWVPPPTSNPSPNPNPNPKQASPNSLAPADAQQSAELQRALAESAASLEEARRKVSKLEAERDAAKKGSDERDAKLKMVRAKKREP